MTKPLRGAEGIKARAAGVAGRVEPVPAPKPVPVFLPVWSESVRGVPNGSFDQLCSAQSRRAVGGTWTANW